MAVDGIRKVTASRQELVKGIGGSLTLENMAIYVADFAQIPIDASGTQCGEPSRSKLDAELQPEVVSPPHSIVQVDALPPNLTPVAIRIACHSLLLLAL
jgi:hypothetical protein